MANLTTPEPQLPQIDKQPIAPTNTDSGQRDQRARRRAAGTELMASSAAGFAFTIVFVVFSVWLGGRFLSTPARMFDLASNAPQLVLAMGLIACLACSQFDLSVGATATLSCYVTIGLTIRSGLPLLASVAIAVGIGGLIGLANGLIITRLKLDAFLATLGTSGAITGISAVYSGSQVFSVSPTSGTLPSWFSGPDSLGAFQQKVPVALAWITLLGVVAIAVVTIHFRLGARRNAGTSDAIVAGGVGVLCLVLAGLARVPQRVNWTIFVIVLVAALLWTFLELTNFGRSLYAIGGSERAAAFAGIRTNALTVSAFTLTGVTAAFAGVLLAATQGSASPGVGEAMLLPAYSAAFMSTVLFSRGRFHIWGTLVGGLFLVWVSSALVVSGTQFQWSQVVNGAVLIAAVAFSTLFRRRA